MKEIMNDDFAYDGSDLDVAPIEHRVVVDAGLIADYDRGSLDNEIEQRFEAHLMTCEDCQDALEAERGLARGLRTMASEDLAMTTVRGGLMAWIARHRWQTVLASALAALVVFAGLSLLRLTNENRRLTTRIAQLVETSPGIPDGLREPLVGVPVTLLGVLRGDAESVSIIEVSDGPFTLAVDIGADPRIRDIEVTILDDEGGVRFSAPDLRANDLEVVQLTFPADFLPAGDYELVARSGPPGDPRELGRYPFRIVDAR